MQRFVDLKFCRGEPMARGPKTVSLARVLAVGGILAGVLVVLCVVQPTLFFDVGPDELAHSLGGEVHAATSSICEAAGSSEWQCTVVIGYSEGQDYRLILDADDPNCWSARAVRGQTLQGRKLSGCVDVLDFTGIG